MTDTLKRVAASLAAHGQHRAATEVADISLAIKAASKKPLDGLKVRTSVTYVEDDDSEWFSAPDLRKLTELVTEAEEILKDHMGFAWFVKDQQKVKEVGEISETMGKLVVRVKRLKVG